MSLKRNHARAVAQEHPANGSRTWTFTLAISLTVLAIMYGLAYWHEARGEAARDGALNSAPITSTH
jgi:hypothetical protein